MALTLVARFCPKNMRVLSADGAASTQELPKLLDTGGIRIKLFFTVVFSRYV